MWAASAVIWDWLMVRCPWTRCDSTPRGLRQTSMYSLQDRKVGKKAHLRSPSAWQDGWALFLLHLQTISLVKLKHQNADWDSSSDLHCTCQVYIYYFHSVWFSQKKGKLGKREGLKYNNIDTVNFFSWILLENCSKHSLSANCWETIFPFLWGKDVSALWKTISSTYNRNFWRPWNMANWKFSPSCSTHGSYPAITAGSGLFVCSQRIRVLLNQESIQKDLHGLAAAFLKLFKNWNMWNLIHALKAKLCKVWCNPYPKSEHLLYLKAFF